jgi:hypothetical protein
MSWFLLSALVFGFWGVTFLFFPSFSNELGGIGFDGSQHAKDWTQLVGLFSFAFAYLLGAAHRSRVDDVRRVVARGTLAITLPSAALMTYWQLIPNRQWLRLDLVNIALLLLMSYGLYEQSNLSFRGRSPESARGPRRPSESTTPRC